MLNNLKLSTKFSLILILVFFTGIIISGISLSVALDKYSESQVTAKALMLIQAMNSVRHYTNVQVNPELEARLEKEPKFLPQTVPSYSAREVFEDLRTNNAFNSFFYKEATLNPTNFRDRADAFETELVQSFRNQPNTKELSGFRPFAGGSLFYIARPITVSESNCLRCHSTAEKAPKSMIATYGKQNGFGWQLNEIVGAQIISVPMTEVVNTARQSFLFVSLAVAGVFSVALLLINLLLKYAVIKPLNRMSAVAHDVSIGKMEADFVQTSHDEIGILAAAFNRMKLSLSMAMEMLNRSQENY